MALPVDNKGITEALKSALHPSMLAPSPSVIPEAPPAPAILKDDYGHIIPPKKDYGVIRRC